MPKQPGGTPKYKRIEKLRELFKRWGKMDKNTVDSQMSGALGVDSEDLSRALYRDLEELVTRGDIEVLYFHRDGTPIDDFDLLIGATAVTHHLTLVTNNFDHLKRIKGIVLEDWTK